jgi:5-methylcytosine-specific restriction enzyme subunit McrC
MVQAIPIENLYYLLSYAWNHFHEGQEMDLSSTACPDLPNLLAKVLACGIHRLARTGFERQYLPQREVTPRLRGRILVAESYRRMTQRNGRMECLFDELSSDTHANRILRTTAERLLRVAELTDENRGAVRIARGLLPDVPGIAITDASFHRIQLHRNTRNYGLLLSICRLIHQSLLPEERNGHRRFRDILRDETVMAKLFEDFVRNFATRHFPEATVSAMKVTWQATDWSEATDERIPDMYTDVTVAWPNRKLILDCKFYQEALVSRFDLLRFHSAHLYQINAYVTNKAVEPGWENVEGMLLYPSNGNPFDHTFTLHRHHRIRVSTINLQQTWKEIESEMLGRLGSNEPVCQSRPLIKIND